MSRISVCLAITLATAGCGPAATEQEQTGITVPAGDEQARLEAMPEAQRDAVFLRAIRDAGRDCQNVEQSTSQGEISGAPAWTATCDNGSQWVIVIGRDGIAQVTNAAELKAAGGNAG